MNLSKILNILSWIFIIAAVIIFIWMVFGESPTFDYFLTVIFGGFMFRIYSSMEGIRIEIGSIREKLGEHTKAIQNIEKKLDNLESRFTRLEK